MNPGFTWKKGTISIYEGTSEIKKADCTDTQPISPTYGAPTGSALTWPHPDRTADITVSLTTTDGTVYTAAPTVKDALIRLAEHVGGPDVNGQYVRGLRQVRISHMSIDLNDFAMAGGTVKEFHLNGVGTVATDGAGISGKIGT